MIGYYLLLTNRLPIISNEKKNSAFLFNFSPSIQLNLFTKKFKNEDNSYQNYYSLLVNNSDQ
jgi:hypothetical protein